MKIVKIVITGGPCGGKSSIVPFVQKAVEDLGYYVIIIPETATQLISGGVAPWTCGTNQEYQVCQMMLQKEKERIYEKAARTMKQDKILMIHDRGQMDNTVYMDESEKVWVFNELKMDEDTLLNQYDAIFHLETSAKQYPEFYSLNSNVARIETVEQACDLDEKTIQAWSQHPYHYIIPGYDNFEDKGRDLLEKLISYLEFA